MTVQELLDILIDVKDKSIDVIIETSDFVYAVSGTHLCTQIGTSITEFAIEAGDE